MNHRIIGTTLPVLELTLESGESVIAVSGELSWMGQSIDMQTTTAMGGGGFTGLFKRLAGGGTLFMTEYTAKGAPGILAFATRMPGHILPVDVSPGKEHMIHRHGFVCGTPGIQIGVGFQQSLGAGIFGGDGFVLQKLSGPCTAWVELGGEVVTYDLAPGETLQVHPGHVGMFEGSVNFDLTLMRGFTNAIFGGDGLFIARLTGPGKVWLQTLTVPNLAHALSPYLGGEVGQSAQSGAVGGIAGAVLRDMFGGGR